MLNGLTGTGLSQPNPPKKNNSKPMGSMWTSGFRLMRPFCFGLLRYAKKKTTSTIFCRSGFDLIHPQSLLMFLKLNLYRLTCERINHCRGFCEIEHLKKTIVHFIHFIQGGIGFQHRFACLGPWIYH
jgi:hypothetical protein